GVGPALSRGGREGWSQADSREAQLIDASGEAAGVPGPGAGPHGAAPGYFCRPGDQLRVELRVWQPARRSSLSRNLAGSGFLTRSAAANSRSTRWWRVDAVVGVSTEDPLPHIRAPS